MIYGENVINLSECLTKIFIRKYFIKQPILKHEQFVIERVENENENYYFLDVSLQNKYAVASVTVMTTSS